MDLSATFPTLKIICVGAEDTARQVIQYDSEMKNRVSEIKVPLMTSEEISQIVTRGFDLLNIKINYPLMCDDIYYYSNSSNKKLFIDSIKNLYNIDIKIF